MIRQSLISAAAEAGDDVLERYAAQLRFSQPEACPIAIDGQHIFADDLRHGAHCCHCGKPKG